MRKPLWHKGSGALSKTENPCVDGAGRIIGENGYRHKCGANGANTAVLLIDDLNWIDPASDALLAPVIEVMSGTNSVHVGRTLEGRALLEEALGLAERVGDRVHQVALHQRMNWIEPVGEPLGSAGVG